MQWINDGLPLLMNALIVEYDIKSGNTSILRECQLIPEDEIKQIESKPKNERLVLVGLRQRETPGLAREMEKAFDDAVEAFITKNGLDTDTDVLAIRRDAVFVVNRPIRHRKISENIVFRPKNQYHAYIQLGRIEFYFKQDGIDIKQFVQADKDVNNALEKLKPGMLSFLQEFVQVAEGCNMDRRKMYRWIADFCTYYKNRELDLEYYREFTRDAAFRVRVMGEETFSDWLSEDMIDDLEIGYNYLNVIVPLMQILV